jgi:hypothetical protein
MPIVENDVERFEAAQLVADLRDLDLVQMELMDQRGITSRVAKRSKELDLALLELPNLDAEIGRLRQDAKLVEDATEDRRRWLRTFRDELADGSVTITLSDEDLVVFALRQFFRHEYRGWSPTFDKHHVLDLLEGWPYHKGGIGHPDTVAHVDIPAPSGGPGPRVGIADTAIFPHDDLVGRYVGDQVGELPQPAPSTAGHATFIAGLILQRAPDAELVVREVLGTDGVNRSSWDVAVKLMGFLREDVSVLNMSFGCLVADSLPPLILRRAVERLSRGMVLVAAAGNNGNLPGRNKAGVTARTPAWPAAFDDVVAVGAYDPHVPEHQRAQFSPHLQLVDLLAPGVRVQSTYLSGEVRIHDRNDDTGEAEDKGTETFDKPGYATWDGTSFAAASVSGEIAARMGVSRMSSHEALDALLESPGDIMPFPLA